MLKTNLFSSFFIMQTHILIRAGDVGFVIKQTLVTFASTTKKNYVLQNAVVVLLVLNSSASILYCQLIRLTCSIT